MIAATETSSSTPQSPVPQAIDPIALRRAFGTFVTGVTVITTRDGDGTPRGMTANSFTSVSLDPPLLLVCVGKAAASFAAFNTSDCFAVNLLHEGQTDVSSVFASKSPDKFQSIVHDRVHTGAPILNECLTWFDCTVHDRIEAGDHVVLIGAVQAFGTSPSAPLGFCRGRYAAIKDPLPPGWLASHSMIVGYLIEADGQILLRSDGKGGWVLPSAKSRKAENELKLEGGDALTLLPEETFLYSVFDVADSDPGYLIYRARLAGISAAIPMPPGFRFFPIANLPYDEIPAREICSLLRRYSRERRDESFSIYMDSNDGGRLARLDGTTLPWAQSAQE
ncbi:flavin reductase [Mesorhizobium sp. INR15]|uniref:flavin reductase n=1 Tax=Mesorhizobium sp. INR15 TaxID=2654248 RepID=UPI0018967365|nr:flavin reductase [Mesorhizobium sp. INR15]QPC89362.1 flavin reductase [Mesorhizobium sp. INR15]